MPSARLLPMPSASVTSVASRRTVPVRVSLIPDVAARGVLPDPEPGAAELLGCRLVGPGALPEPRGVVRPPGALLGAGGVAPLLDRGRVVVGDPVAGLGVARRVDQRRDVPVGGEHEAHLAAEQLAAAVARLPRADVDRKSTRLNSSHANISYAVFCLK